MDQHAKVREFALQVRQQFPDAKVLLFGSRARGDALTHSDYDVIIVSDLFEGIGWIKRIETLVHYWQYDDDIDILPYTQKEFLFKQKESSTIRGAMKGIIVEI